MFGGDVSDPIHSGRGDDLSMTDGPRDHRLVDGPSISPSSAKRETITRTAVPRTKSIRVGAGNDVVISGYRSETNFFGKSSPVVDLRTGTASGAGQDSLTGVENNSGKTRSGAKPAQRICTAVVATTTC
jgi:hypothetical protein